MSTPRRLWIDKTGQPVITMTANGERDARRWGWAPARAVSSDPAPAPSVVPEAAVEAGVAGVQERIAWASLHWGPVQEVDASAWPHVVRAALTAALPHLTPEPRVITTADELAALPEQSVIRDRYADVGVLMLGQVHYPETAPQPRAYAARWLPATVLYTPKETDR